jgi:hypothetical protein
VEDDLRLLMKSDPSLVKEIVGKHSSDLLARVILSKELSSSVHISRSQNI